MKKIILASTLFLTLSLTVLLTGCLKDSGKLPVTTAPSVSTCDTITYTKHIKPILEANCTTAGCHDGTNSNPLLGSYEQAKDRADAGRIQARVIEENPSRMPPTPNPALTAAQKELITCWLNNGKKQ